MLTISHKPAPRRVLRLLGRRWIAAWWDARSAVSASISLAEYLRFRAAQYQRRLTALGLHLPLEVVLKGSDLKVGSLPPPQGGASASKAPTAEAAGRAWELAL